MARADEVTAPSEAPTVTNRLDERRLLLCAILGFVVISSILFGDYFVGSESQRLISSRFGDTTRYFRFIREFAAAELLAGNIPLWNPHSFSGTPFMAVFQTSVFYPLNILYLVLPIATALNFDFAVHLVIFGSLSYAWLRGWRLHPLAAFFAGVMIVLGATNSLRILAGQLSTLNTLAWTPLLLMAVDRLAERRSLGWTLVGIGAVTLMILAGHPPTVYMIGLTTGIYILPILLAAENRGALVMRMLPLALLPVFMSAIQLWPGLAVGMEGTRGGGVDFEFATSVSFPPENWLTALAPEMFGDGKNMLRTYFGRWAYWDASIYIGLVGLLLFVTGAIAGGGNPKTDRLRRISLVLVVVSAVLAMGRYTPIYRLPFEYLPGFDRFRSPSKFAFHATFFASAIGAIGLDRMLGRSGSGSIRDAAAGRAIRIAGLTAATLTVVLSALLLWAWLVPTTKAPHGSLAAVLSDFGGRRLRPQALFTDWEQYLRNTLSVSIAIAALSTACVVLALRHARAVLVLVLIGVVDLMVFAWDIRGNAQLYPFHRNFLAAAFRHAGEDRVLIRGKASLFAMTEHGYDLWGYEPVILDRYARFMAYTQDRDPGDLINTGGNHPDRFHPLLKMLRGRALLKVRRGRPPAQGQREAQEFDGAYPRFYLASDYRVIEDFDTVLRALDAPGFDPRHTLILESQPDLAVGERANSEELSVAAASLRLLGESSDHLEIELQVAAHALLVITDSYAEGWRVVDLQERVEEYRLMPANAVLRAIPLHAGRHHFRVEYSPAIYRVAAWSSASSLFAYLIAVGYWVRQRHVS